VEAIKGGIVGIGFFEKRRLRNKTVDVEQLKWGRDVERLVLVLRHKHQRLRAKAADALSDLGWQPDNDADKAIYLIAQRKWDDLAELGQPAVPFLLNALDAKEQFVQEAAASVLGEMKEAHAAKPLVQLLTKIRREQFSSDRTTDFVRAIQKALIQIGPPSVSPLLTSLVAMDHLVLDDALEALGQIGDKRAVSALTSRLKHREPLVRKAAAKALAQMNATEAIGALTNAIDPADQFAGRAIREALEELQKRAGATTDLSRITQDELWSMNEHTVDVPAELASQLGSQGRLRFLGTAIAHVENWRGGSSSGTSHEVTIYRAATSEGLRRWRKKNKSELTELLSDLDGRYVVEVEHTSYRTAKGDPIKGGKVAFCSGRSEIVQFLSNEDRELVTKLLEKAALS
jgi:HEAT repeat protein